MLDDEVFKIALQIGDPFVLGLIEIISLVLQSFLLSQFGS